MNGKKLIIAGLVLNTVLAAFAASYYHQHLALQRLNRDETKTTALTGHKGKFGPLIETVLPAATSKGNTDITDILDMETGRLLLQPAFEDFNFRADAIMAWIRSSGLDISCSVWSSGAMCVTYDMTILPVERKCWEETTEAELLSNPGLAPQQQTKRRLLVLGNNRPDTYIFVPATGLWECCGLLG